MGRSTHLMSAAVDPGGVMVGNPLISSNSVHSSCHQTVSYNPTIHHLLPIAASFIHSASAVFPHLQIPRVALQSLSLPLQQLRIPLLDVSPAAQHGYDHQRGHQQHHQRCRTHVPIRHPVVLRWHLAFIHDANTVSVLPETRIDAVTAWTIPSTLIT
jgi:hypothetical protein